MSWNFTIWKSNRSTPSCEITTFYRTRNDEQGKKVEKSFFKQKKQANAANENDMTANALCEHFFLFFLSNIRMCICSIWICCVDYDLIVFGCFFSIQFKFLSSWRGRWVTLFFGCKISWGTKYLHIHQSHLLHGANYISVIK